MTQDRTIEQRLAAVESAVADLQQRLAGAAPARDWVERFTGALKDEPAFAEVIAYGRALGEEDRPREGDVD